MNTTVDFENAPIGATATSPDGGKAVKTFDTDELPWLSNDSGWCSNDDMSRQGFTFDNSPHPAPTTAREALELVWKLAHEMKEGHEVPTGTECIAKVSDGEFMTYRSLKPFDGVRRPGWAEARTLDPFPEPEPDWLTAPAVLATDDRDRRGSFFPVTGSDKYWQSAQSGLRFHWNELRDVTPLYPKEDA